MSGEEQRKEPEPEVFDTLLEAAAAGSAEELKRGFNGGKGKIPEIRVTKHLMDNLNQDPTGNVHSSRLTQLISDNKINLVVEET